MVILVPAMRYEVPSVNLVKEPEMPLVTFKVPVISRRSPVMNMPLLPIKEPLTTRSPPNTETSDFFPIEPETKNDVSVPGKIGNKESGRLATITEPETPITELDCLLPDILPTNAMGDSIRRKNLSSNLNITESRFSQAAVTSFYIFFL
jgi:hypothetical protein